MDGSPPGSCPWDSPGKNTGVGCHFLLQCMKVKSESEVTQSYLTLRDPMDGSLPGSSIHGIFQARVLEWGDPKSLFHYELRYRIKTLGIHCGIKFHLFSPCFLPSSLPLPIRENTNPLGREKRQLLFIFSLPHMFKF